MATTLKDQILEAIGRGFEVRFSAYRPARAVAVTLLIEQDGERFQCGQCISDTELEFVRIGAEQRLVDAMQICQSNLLLSIADETPTKV
jgi:hypothetical protein